MDLKFIWKYMFTLTISLCIVLVGAHTVIGHEDNELIIEFANGIVNTGIVSGSLILTLWIVHGYVLNRQSDYYTPKGKK
jgi:hypothetical protein